MGAMFIKVTQTGNRRYAQLVESYRNEEGKPRQRTVCTLGRLQAGGEVDTLIASLQRAQGIAPAPSALDGFRFTDSRHAGDIWALSELWRSLGFDDLAACVAGLEIRSRCIELPAPDGHEPSV